MERYCDTVSNAVAFCLFWNWQEWQWLHLYYSIISLGGGKTAQLSIITLCNVLFCASIVLFNFQSFSILAWHNNLLFKCTISFCIQYKYTISNFEREGTGLGICMAGPTKQLSFVMFSALIALVSSIILPYLHELVNCPLILQEGLNQVTVVC